jgi:serine/threonine protein kinase
MSDSSADRNPLDPVAEEFVTRFRAGERPSLTEYAERHPELADDIRELFPALVEMEQLKPVTADNTGAFVGEINESDPDRIGEFRILRRVGRGGMGVVYEAVQESLGRHVALKVLPAETLLDPKRRERFRREARSAAKLHHTNIVPVFGTGEADGRHYYAMQFIAGHPLDAVIDEVRHLREHPGLASRAADVAHSLLTGTFPKGAEHSVSPRPESHLTPRESRGAKLGSPLADSGRGETTSTSHLTDQPQVAYPLAVARVVAQAADALAYAHAQGILHRDVKPSNLLLDYRGTVWITDFGLAKSDDSENLTDTGDIVGTVRYMAPERFRGECDARADVYALGLTLYELLTLRPAYAASDRLRLIDHIARRDPPRPRTIDPRIPRDLETIVMKAIDKDPCRRYATAGDMAADLHRFLADEPITARRIGPAERQVRWARRNPLVASLTAAVILVTAGGFAATAA